MKLPLFLLFLTCAGCTKEAFNGVYPDLRMLEERSFVDRMPVKEIIEREVDTIIIKDLEFYRYDGITFGERPDPRLKLQTPIRFSEPFGQRLHYPEIAKRSGMEGSCKVQFLIDSSGRVSRITYLEYDSKVFSDAIEKMLKKSGKIQSFPPLKKKEKYVLGQFEAVFKLKPPKL